MPDGEFPGRLILIIWSMPLTGALPQLPESHRQALGGQSETADENAEQHEHRRAVRLKLPRKRK